MQRAAAFLALLVIGSFTATSFAAEDQPPAEPRVSVKPLDLTRPPSVEELMAAGQLGGALHPTDDSWPGPGPARQALAGQKQSGSASPQRDAVNLSFGQAIQRWNRHEYNAAAELFAQHIQRFPNSPWTAEAQLHLACEATYQGRYREAEERYQSLLRQTRDKPSLGARRLANKAKLRLGVLKSHQNNFADSQKYFQRLAAEGLDWREQTYATHWLQRLSAYRAEGTALLNCGFLALGELLERRGQASQAATVLGLPPRRANGQTVADLRETAAKLGYTLVGLRLGVEELDRMPLPAIVQIQGKSQGDQGHYWILKDKQGDILRLHDPQSGRHFRQNVTEFDYEWDGVALVFADGAAALPGVRLTEEEMANLAGGCCGLPRPEEDLGDPGCGGGQGECIWRVNPVNMNFFMTDTPLWYNPPVGPAVAIALSYNSQSAITIHEPFGNKWQFNYGSYLVVDPGDTVIIFMPDGRRDQFTGDGAGNYTPPVGVHNKLARLASNRWELRFPDDSVFIYDIPAGTNSQQPFLVAIKDAYDQQLTFGYNSNVQLTTITDAVGKVTTLTYNATGLVEKVTDPFSRNALFEYDGNRNLTKITDMGGYSSQLSYDANVYVTSIQKGDDRWQIYIEPNGQTVYYYYPPPGASMWENYRITITHPNGEKEEYFYSGDTLKGWHVSPNNYIQYVDANINNGAGNVPKTLYYFSNYSALKGAINRIDYPDGGDVIYSYDQAGNVTELTDADNKYQEFTYNSMGRVTSAKAPKGNTTRYVYAANGVDLLSVQDDRGAIAFEYNSKHGVELIKDRRNNNTRIAYNTLGQIIRIAGAEGATEQTVTTFIYSADRRLQSVQRNSQTVSRYTYDTFGRVRTETDAAGLTLTYSYDNLNQLTQIAYPDGRSEQFSWSNKRPFLLNQETSRGGKVNRYGYDPQKQLVESINPEGGLIRMNYDANGNLVKLIDPNSKTTAFGYNNNDIPTSKTYPNSQGDSYTYDAVGRIKTRTNARGIVTTYSYDANSNLVKTDYADDTPDVDFIYDNLNRLIQRTDGVGVYRYFYDGNDNLTAVDGPWANDTLNYTYDALDRRTSLTPQGGVAVNYRYDGLSRPVSIQQGNQTYVLSYQGVSNLLTKLTRPNGSATRYTNDALQRLTLARNELADGSLINSFAYQYNTDDNRSRETVNNGPAITNLTPGLKTYEVNELNQLVSSTNPARTYEYDADGNMTRGYTPDGYAWTAVYDAENRLKRLQYTDGGGVTYATEYRYQGNDLVGRILKYRNGALINDIRLVYDGFLVVQERDQANATVREYLWRDANLGGIGRLLNLRQGGTVYDYFFDARGNVVTLLDAAGQVKASYGYRPFGEITEAAGSLAQPMRFSTKYYDPESGLSNFGYRFYYASAGRWVNRDPIGEDGGINLYSYVNNNPISEIDPLGNCPWCIGAAIGFGFDLVEQLIENGGDWSCINLGQLAVSTALGAVGGGIGGRGLSSFLKGLSNPIKGTVGESLSMANNWLRGSRLISTQTRSIPGFRTIVDSTWRSIGGTTYYVESKFGTSGLTAAQHAAANALGNAYHVERWGYPFFERVGAYVGGSAGGIAGSNTGNSNCKCH